MVWYSIYNPTNLLRMVIPRQAVNWTIQTHSKKWATMSCTTTGILKATASCHTYENGFVFRCCISNFNHYHVVMTCLTLLLGKGQLNYGGLSWSKKCPWQVISLFILVFNNDTLLTFEYVVWRYPCHIYICIIQNKKWQFCFKVL